MFLPGEDESLRVTTKHSFRTPGLARGLYHHSLQPPCEQNPQVKGQQDQNPNQAQGPRRRRPPYPTPIPDLLVKSVYVFCIFFFQIFTQGYVFCFRERGRETEPEKHQRDRETSISHLLYLP